MLWSVNEEKEADDLDADEWEGRVRGLSDDYELQGAMSMSMSWGTAPLIFSSPSNSHSADTAAAAAAAVHNQPNTVENSGSSRRETPRNLSAVTTTAAPQLRERVGEA